MTVLVPTEARASRPSPCVAMPARWPADIGPDDALPRRHVFAHRRHHPVHRRIVGTHRPHPAQSERRGLLARLHRSRPDPTVPLSGGDLGRRASPAHPSPRSRGRLDPAQFLSGADNSRTESAGCGPPGYPLGPANIAEHEAIAATQAAIWRFTNDLELDDPAAQHPAWSSAAVPTASSSSSTTNPN